MGPRVGVRAFRPSPRSVPCADQQCPYSANVSEEPGRASASAELDAVFLDAKLRAPRPRPASVSRAELVDRARRSGRRAVAITAPAGYGKTSLLSEWVAAEERRVAWVSLDRLDDDPVGLLTLLASAFARATGRDQELAADMVGPGDSVLGRGAPRLAAALRSSEEPFLLVLDDLHELRSPICHDVLGILIAGVPPGSQIAVASRAAPPFVPLLRTEADVVEILAEDLALDAAGAEQIFAAVDVDVSPEEADLVTQRTEGWPVGIYLASLIARDGGRQAAAAVTGDDRFVADYLQREALLHLPEETLQFLRRTSVLDQMSASLCDAVVGAPGGSGEAGAQETLRALEASSVFLVPLDRRRGWYRYHALFREFLQGELARVEPDVVMKLHLRAADWYEAHGSPARALEHLLSTTERERSVHLVTALSMPAYQAGQMSTTERWLAALGDEAIAGYPPLAVLATQAAVLTGRGGEAERWSAVLDEATFDLLPEDGTASFDSGRAMVRALMCAGGPEQMRTDSAFAAAAEPEWSVWRSQALMLQGEASLLRGDRPHAARLFGEASAAATRDGNVVRVVLIESELALLDMDGGRWDDAADRVNRVLALVAAYRIDDYVVAVLGFAAAARLQVHRGDVEEAGRQLTRAMRARPLCTYAIPFLAVRARVHMALACVATGDRVAARHLLREIDDVLMRRPDLGDLLREVAGLRTVLAPSVGGGAGAPGTSPLTPAELRILPYLQTHLTIAEIGERLHVSRNTASSQIGSIYRKLGVSSRNAAVGRAVAMRLLGQ